MGAESTERCTWCGRPIEPEDGWRVAELPGARRAAFCRLEHVVPWEMQGARWEAGEIDEPAGLAAEPDACAQCGAPLGEVRLLAVRHRGQHRVLDGFCSAAHLAAWAKAGGRWR
jgi:hypothetical protein